MSSVVVKTGQRVTRGQLIGYSGNTGRSGGPHCHFSVVEFANAYSNGLYGRVNPDRFIGSASITPAGNIVAAAERQLLIPDTAEYGPGIPDLFADE